MPNLLSVGPLLDVTAGEWLVQYGYAGQMGFNGVNRVIRAAELQTRTPLRTYWMRYAVIRSFIGQFLPGER